MTFVAVFSFSITSFAHQVPSPISPETVNSSSNLFADFSAWELPCPCQLGPIYETGEVDDTILLSDRSQLRSLYADLVLMGLT